VALVLALERLHGAHGVLEQVALGARALLGLAAQPFALGLLRGPLLQRAAQGLEVGKRLGFERGGHG